MGTIDYENNVYDFDWVRILILFICAPLFALGMFYSHNWVWLHEISVDITVWLLNLLTGGESYAFMDVRYPETPFGFVIVTENGESLARIYFETLCAGVHAIAIFVGVILFAPHTRTPGFKYRSLRNLPFFEMIGALFKELFNNQNKIWLKKAKGIFWTTLILFIVNFGRMVLQLGLYRDGSAWEDVHYPFSVATSFVAVACVLIMHKFVPEFILSLIWIGESIKELTDKRIGKIADNGIKDEEETSSDPTIQTLNEEPKDTPPNRIPKEKEELSSSDVIKDV